MLIAESTLGWIFCLLFAFYSDDSYSNVTDRFCELINDTF